MQTKSVRDLWVLSKSCQTNSWSSSLLSQPSPTPTLQGWNFLLMAQCKRPLSYGKLTLKMSTRDRRRRKLQNRNACHDGAFWQNLESLQCWHTFLFFPCQRDRQLLLKLHTNTSEKYTNVAEGNRSCWPGYKKRLIVKTEYGTLRKSWAAVHCTANNYFYYQYLSMINLLLTVD